MVSSSQIQQSQADEIQVVGLNIEARSICLDCPIGHSRMDVPVISKNCEEHHLQPFDLKNFILSNSQLTNINQRWKCPIPGCDKRARLWDLNFCG